MSEASALAVLVVEDDPAVRAVVVEALHDEGYPVRVARDGVEAITALREGAPPPDRLCLVLLDMMLPKADGVDVLRALTDLGAYVPVVAMSADRARLTEARANGAQATVAKPFDLDRLVQTVERTCRR